MTTETPEISLKCEATTGNTVDKNDDKNDKNVVLGEGEHKAGDDARQWVAKMIERKAARHQPTANPEANSDSDSNPDSDPDLI